MRRVILMMLLAVVSSSAAAEWVRGGGSEEADSYANPSSIRKAGNKVKMWRLHDLKTSAISVDGQLYLSIKEQIEFDCKNEQSRSLYLSHHSENMGEGKVVFVDSRPYKWSPVVPDTLDEAQLKAACKRR